MGCYTGGTVYTTNGTLQITADTADTAFAIDRTYASVPPRGHRYVIELHNDNHSFKTLPEDLRLLKSLGFNVDGKLLYEWSQVDRHLRKCPLQLVPTFYTMLFIEVCCGETSELRKLEHTTSTCLGVRVTERHDILDVRTLEMLNHCVQRYGFGKSIMIWMSFRCTGGSQFQLLNEWKAHQEGNLATIAKIEGARREFHDHFKATMPLVSLVRGLGGHLALELPRHCMYWS